MSPRQRFARRWKPSLPVIRRRGRSYVLDDQGLLRKHMIVFINGETVRDRDQLTDAVTDDAEIYVMQALSGG